MSSEAALTSCPYPREFGPSWKFPLIGSAPDAEARLLSCAVNLSRCLWMPLEPWRRYAGLVVIARCLQFATSSRTSGMTSRGSLIPWSTNDDELEASCGSPLWLDDGVSAAAVCAFTTLATGRSQTHQTTSSAASNIASRRDGTPFRSYFNSPPQGAPIFDNAYQYAKPFDRRNNSAVERAIAIHMCGRDEEIGMTPIASILEPCIGRFFEW